MEDSVTESIRLSAYHFDPDRIDPRYDSVVGLGHFEGDWSDEVAAAVEASKPVSFASRGNTEANTYLNPPPAHANFKQDENHYQLEKAWFDNTDIDYDDTIVINKTSHIGPKIQKMLDMFQFTGPLHYTVHCQLSGQVFPYHIDFFHRRSRLKDQPQDKIIRVMVMLTDWEPGHFISYGNHVFTRWKAGDFHTFSHADTPHSTANAAYNPRVMLLITGVKSDATEEFLYKARTTRSIKID
jgi:hypothetical protein